MFKKLLKYVPLLYVIMIFLSFYQLYHYFDEFEIAIYVYISLYELLFYFIPFFAISYLRVVSKILPYILPFVIILIIITAIIGKKWYIEMIARWDSPKKYIKSEVKYLRYKTFFYIFSLLIFAVLTYLIIYINCIPFNQLEKFIRHGADYNWLFMIMFCIWCILFYVIFLKFISNFFERSKIIFYYNIICFTIFIFTFNEVKLNYNLRVFKEKGPYDSVSFEYLGKVDSTDTLIDNTKLTNRIVIGITQNYLFIRDMKNNVNEIYNLNDVKKLKITRLHK